MTTIRQLITDALRESGIIEVGTVPEADEFNESLRKLQTLIRSLFGNELGDPLTTLNYGTLNVNSVATIEDASSYVNAVYVPLNYRVVFNNSATKTLYLHPKPQDGSRIAVVDNASNFNTYPITLNGNGRKIENAASVVLNTASLSREWFYRADLANWARITDLVAEDESPFPLEFDELLTTLLALRLNPRYGAETRGETVDALTRMKKLFRARYSQATEVGSEDGLLRLNQKNSYTIVPSGDRFNNGII